MSTHQSSRVAPLAASEIPEFDGPLDDATYIEEPSPRERESAETIKARLIGWIDEVNIAVHIDQQTLDHLGDLVVREYNIDETSRAEWKDDADRALDFATQKAEPKLYPWPESSNVIFPLITGGAMLFNARSYGAIIQGRNVVKGIVWGDDKGTPATEDGKEGGRPIIDPQTQQPVWRVPPGEKQIRANKIGEHMSWQLLEQMAEWEEQTDTMLMQLPIIGGAVRKTFRDVREDCNTSVLVHLSNLVWNFHAPSFEKAPRHTEILELYPHEIDEMERDNEAFLHVVYGPGDSGEDGEVDQTDTSAPHQFLEQHRRFDLDGDGYPEPLIVTVHKRSAKVVRIVARYEEEGIITDGKSDKLKRIVPVDSYTLFRFLPNPKGGSYPIGFGHLLKPLNEAINTTINQMFDAGHLQIAGGGFIGTGLNLHAGPVNFDIGEYKPVNAKGGNIRDAIFPIPWPGPNAVLFQLLGFLVQAAKDVASIQDVLTGDAAMANAPPTTVLALIEQGMKVYTAIHKRIYRALKSEFAKLYRLNRIYLVEDERYRVGDAWRVVSPDDYRLGGGVEPVADPTQVTDMQKLGRAMVLQEAAKNNPLINPLVATRRYLEAANIERIEELLPDKMPPPQPSPEMLKAQTEQTKAQTEAQRLQFDIASDQARLGETRAHEMQLYTQAMLNFEKARSSSQGATLQWVEANLNTLRLHIEALNTSVKAADVDAKFHGHAVAREGHHLAHHGHMADIAQRAKEAASEQPGAGPGSDGDGSDDISGAVPGPAGVPQPGGGGDLGTGVPGVAPQPNQSGIPPVFGPSGG